jgi:hypothetical protein
MVLLEFREDVRGTSLTRMLASHLVEALEKGTQLQSAGV